MTRTINAERATGITCPEHPDAELYEEAVADNSPGIVGSGGTNVYLYCPACPDGTSALACYYVA